MRKAARYWFLIVAVVLALCAVCSWLTVAWLHSPTRGLPHRYLFDAGGLNNWQAYGGAWNIHGGSIENDSDDRGAKILIGSPYWKNYSVEADMELLGTEGDAGLIARSSNEETGVDAYDGYYAGLRDRENQLSTDNSLLLAREDYEYEQLKSIPIPGGVIPFHWYHLKLLVYGCRIAASVTDPSQPDWTITTSAVDPHCFTHGRIGLRSYASGGIWKNVRVRPATRADLEKMLAVPPPRNLPVHKPASPPASAAAELPAPTITTIHQLRLMPFMPRQTATIRGVVVSTAPRLYVQDSTGGAAIHEARKVPLKIGDEVQVTGLVDPGDFSPSLDHATVRLLWTSKPVPPVFVTSFQASTGAFDAMFVELKGRVQQRYVKDGGTLVLHLQDGPQTFQAIFYGEQSASLFHQLRPGSVVSVRGICVVSSAFTHNLTPFAVLLRSSNDLNILRGPPWWTLRHWVELLVILFALALLAQYLHGRMDRWRMRAVIDERERLAHEMHDTLAQSFAGIGFQLEAIRNQISPNDQASEHLNLARELARYSHEEARRNVASLRPEFLASLGLVAALKRFADQRLAGGNVRVIAEGRQAAQELPPVLTDTFYRIGQEAIANAIRHANPSEILIGLRIRGTTVEFTIEDDGVGFQESEVTAGFGMEGMRKRAEMISARFSVHSYPFRGTTITVQANLPPQLTWKTIPEYAWRALRELLRHGKSDHAGNSHPHRG